MSAGENNAPYAGRSARNKAYFVDSRQMPELHKLGNIERFVVVLV